MEYEAFESRYTAGEWHVEAFDADGDCHVTVFCGPLAMRRANEYADLKNSQEGLGN